MPKGGSKFELVYKNYKIPVRFVGLEKSALLAKETIVWKTKAGLEAMRMRVDAVSKKPMPKGSQIDIWVDVNGTEVAKTDLISYSVKDGVETPVTPFEKTRVIELNKELTLEQDANMLPEEYYEIIPDSEEDIGALYELAKEMDAEKKVLAGVLVFREGWVRYGVVISPKINKTTGEFAVVGRTVTDKITPSTFFPIPKQPYTPKAAKPKGKTLFLPRKITESSERSKVRSPISGLSKAYWQNIG